MAKKAATKKVATKTKAVRTTKSAEADPATKSMAARVREWIAMNPTGSAKDCMAVIGCSATQFYQAKGTKKKRKGPKAAGKPSSNGEVSVATLLAAKAMAEKLGGVQAAKAALDILAKLG